ncbi:DUF885 family protein [Flavihumibacter profundi]|uniref:DUF885 family protein n=1 Tax=Flavihumibacter profundi TaxID=2716883 RepID=UPI001CC5E0D2|nr:DUF885 family protein [Flavihumibacter profundi]MBZ5858905.1 DUF885 domain-containing protein [Flavihumibacter profundi]
MKKIICLAFAWLYVFPGLVFSQVNTNKEISLQATELTNTIIQYREDRGSLDRFYFLESSPERITRLKELDNQYSRKLDQFSFDQLSDEGKVDFILFRKNIQDDQFRLTEDEKNTRLASKYLSFSDAVFAAEKDRRRGLAPDAPNLAKTMNGWAVQLKAAIKNLDNDKQIDLNSAFATEKLSNDLSMALKSIHDFYNGYDPQYSWWMETPYRSVDSLLKIYRQNLVKQGRKNAVGADDGSGIIGRPIGKAEVLRQLKQEYIAYSPEELIAIAEKEFAWCDKEMLKASNEMGFGNDWKKALEKVKNTYVPAGKQPEMILDLYNQSVDFLKKNDLVTIPPIAEETWRMSMMSPERQLVNPFFLGGEEIIISYPTNSMSEEDKLMSMRGNNPHFSRATVHHELIAGHHLQMFMNSRNHAYRNFGTPFWIEGWALYWEMILWDKGFPRGPEDRIGMLFWRMHRCARIIFSLNYHLGKWTPQQCIDFLVNRVGHERANAEGEVRRSFTGGYGPLYQVAYLVGGLQFYALNKELVGTGKMTAKQFHDAVLQENEMPVELLRTILLQKPPNIDFTTKWRFYPLPAK